MVINHLNPAEMRDNLALEFRRGAVVLAVLSQLGEEHYGYSLKKLLAAHGFDVDEGTLYPLLRRLESQGLLVSRWKLEESRPRRYYQISPAGRELRAQLGDDWRTLVQSLERILSTTNGSEA
jgi:PadR family transcriptional regulator PadR